jgi:hypothetical protein
MTELQSQSVVPLLTDLDHGQLKGQASIYAYGEHVEGIGQSSTDLMLAGINEAFEPKAGQIGPHHCQDYATQNELEQGQAARSSEE